MNPHAVAVDSAGNVVVGGEFSDTTDLGGGSVTATGSKDIFLTMRSASGSYVWSKHFGIAATSVSFDRGVFDAAGNLYVVGKPSAKALDVGCGAMPTGYSEFVAKLSPTGACVWSTGYAGGGTPSETIALDPSGNLLIGGAFLRKLSPAGTQLWVKSLGSVGPAQVGGIGSDASGNILIDGTFPDKLDLGCGSVTGLTTQNVFLAKVDPMGVCMWSKGFGAGLGGPLAVDALGGPAITGGFRGSVDFGGGVTLNGISAPYTSTFIAKYTSTGAYEWAYGGTPTALTVVSAGTGVAAHGSAIVSTGSFKYGSLSLGGHVLGQVSQPAPGQSPQDAYLSSIVH